MSFREWEILLAGMAVGPMLVLAFSIAKAKATAWAKVTGIGFCIGVIGYAFEGFVLPEPIWIYFISALTLTFLWPFVAIIFGISVSKTALLIPGGLILLVFVLRVIVFDNDPAWLVVFQDLLQISIGALVVLVVWRSEADDLDSRRRAIRRPLLLTVGVFVIVRVVVASLSPQGWIVYVLVLANGVATAALSLAGALVFTMPRPSLLESRTPKRELKVVTSEDEALLARLKTAMDEEEVWREEGLTVGGLAEKLGLPEHRLRPVINQQLGFRNFATFINSRRLEEAKNRLADSAQAQETVASIAYACGFGSLGPFGRAFKEETGLTPTAYRKKNLRKHTENGSAPISKSAVLNPENGATE